MKTRALTKKDYSLLLSLDKKVYPTDSPVTPKILDNWFAKNPEFGMVFEEDNKIIGLAIFIPLNSAGWNKLIKGELAESELNEKTIFDNTRDKEIGIHCYHLEKLDNSIKGFFKEGLIQVNKLILQLRKENPSLRVIGFSGLAVTSEGIGLMYNKLNCRERDYLCSEHIMEKEGKKIIVNTSSLKEIELKLKEGYNYVNRCKMLVTFPGEISLVWDFIK